MPTITTEQFETDIINNLKNLPIALTKNNVEIGKIEELNKNHLQASYKEPTTESIISKVYPTKSKKTFKILGTTFDYYMTRDLKPI